MNRDTIIAKYQGYKNTVGNGFTYIRRKAKIVTVLISQKQHENTVERIKKVGDDFRKSAVYKDWIDDQNIKGGTKWKIIIGIL